MPGVSVSEARALVDSGALMVDVREPYEWEEARIPGAVLIPLGEVATRHGELPRGRTLIIQCRSGNRSRYAARTLLDAGFTDVRNLEGGILRWAEAGFPVDFGSD